MKELLILLVLGVASEAPVPEKSPYTAPQSQKECRAQSTQTPTRDSSRERTLGRERPRTKCVTEKK